MKMIIAMPSLLLILMTSGPGAPLAAEMSGKMLYERDCIACHAADGSGDTTLGRQLHPYPARDLRPKVLSRAESRQTIMQGRLKTGMHAHGKQFDAAAIERLLDYIASFPYQARPEQGRKLYQEQCAHCHAADATEISAPNLILSELSDIGMAEIIRNGHAGTIMGGFKHQLSNSQIEDILVWLRFERYGLRTGCQSNN
ncbi:MAG: cytochrome c [Mariprofundus sp.]